MNIENKKRFDNYVSSKALEGFSIVDKNSEALIAVLKKSAKPVNHLLHGLITAGTCGFWGIVWIIMIIQSKKEIKIRVSIDESGNLIEETVQ